MPKILFLTLHRPNRSPSQRFRFEQYLSYFKENNYNCFWSYLIENEEADKQFYSSNNYLGKFKIFSKSIIKRFSEIRNSHTYDLIFIQRECFMLGTTFFERKFSKKGKVVFDFDDAIWLQNVSKANKSLAFLKNPQKTKGIISISNLVFAGNEYLANYAKQYNANVKVIPTTIDTLNHHNQVKIHKEKEVITIGWTGTHSTLKYLEDLGGVVEALSNKFTFRFLVICDKAPSLNWKGLEFTKWKRETEIEDLLQIDIGIMPLSDTEWAKGKCGFKILQYMALGIPAVAAPVGVNKEIVEHGINGYLASTSKDWIMYITRLAKDANLRNRMGKAGRQTVVDKYSVEANKDLYLKYFKEVLEQ